ncbi:hypothetical protein ACWDYH_12675 [Nocardia goodfellowii]
MSDRITEPTAARLPVRLGVVAAACAAAALLGPPTAGATVTRIGVFADTNVGSATNYGTGCTHTVQAFVTDPVAPVYFYDNGIPLATIEPSGGVAILKWVPATPGTHTLSAVQVPDDRVTATIALRVGVGTHIGYSCIVNGG